MGVTERRKARKEYASLARKYGLPKLEELEEEFHFYLQEGPVLPNVLVSILRKMGHVETLIEEILYPRKFLLVNLGRFFTEEEKEELLEFYKKLEAKLFLGDLALLSGEDRVKILKELIEFHRKEVKPFSKKLYGKVIEGLKGGERKREVFYLR
ncbi:MAG: hypothetical protein QW507_01150 [Candidatus Nanoarchaeia archaeon]|nr:hypothetical protein [Candidatus Haiyanarchaeum thermophilum]MCW1303422.1 hypothetical protein [Candidatus Haiyanarchaeum thermophilum]MCW1303891.1 hypothetical protein [Candidatus Haiyanarchaeum thermophilum]MCW1306876.1 hypothetical protein [Candidatus Haiyanarchaeum thermophilum]MCW1307448.1 hypothetical protein [Candidatus Haiyanarchaeum thermophilum]